MLRRTARAIRGHRHVVARAKLANESRQRTVGAAVGRASNGPETERCGSTRDDLTVAMLADQYRHALAAVSPQQGKHLPMPEREDNRLPCPAKLTDDLRSDHPHPPRQREQSDGDDPEAHPPRDIRRRAGLVPAPRPSLTH